jgi:hypothetical protein
MNGVQLPVELLRIVVSRVRSEDEAERRGDERKDGRPLRVHATDMLTQSLSRQRDRRRE